MRPYHPANLPLQQFPAWKVIALAWVAKALGVQFKIDGIPFGSARNANPAKMDTCSTFGSLK